MKLISLYRVELRRLLLSKGVWLVAVLSLCAPLLGYSLYPSIWMESMTGDYIGNPVLAGTTVGAVFWAVLAMKESNRVYRNNTSVLTDAIASPLSLSTARVIAMMTISMLVTCVCSVIYLPYTMVKMEYLFQADFYFANFLVFMLPTWWISILLAESFYQLSSRMEIAVILYILLVCLSLMGVTSSGYFEKWINPMVIAFSDGFVTWWPLRMGLYTRVTWLCIAIGAWCISLLAIRKYQKGLLLSVGIGLKKVSVLVGAIVFVVLGVLLWVKQPFIDHGPDEWILEDEMVWSSGTISEAHYTIETHPRTGTITAKAEYEVKRPYDGEAELLLNPGYDIKSITYDGEEIAFWTSDEHVDGHRATYFEVPGGSKNGGKLLTVEYSGFPTLAKVMAWFSVQDVVDEEYILLGGETLFPMTEYYSIGKSFLEITIPDDLTPYLDHVPMTEYLDNQDGTRTWSSECSVYVRDFSAAKYEMATFMAGDTEVKFSYSEVYHDAVEEIGAVQAVKDVLEYCTAHYGKYDWIDKNSLILLQKGAIVTGGYAHKGVSTWFESVLSPSTLADAEKGASATDVFIHEMVHQWWGDLGLQCEDDGLWSCEGLTVYTTYRIAKERYGELYAKQYYVDQWQAAVDAQNRNFYNRHPEYFELLPETYQARIRMTNEGTNKYMRMPLVILKAQELVGGEDAMDEILREMYACRSHYGFNYGYEAFSYDDFLKFCGLTKEELNLD
ncbi:MAG: hypothetical protein IJ326_10745 [Lachnospiraceae bacterium]|nr:hypothetical protein [Lachnospiraceae bacterium]